jgi:hypothetical protein
MIHHRTKKEKLNKMKISVDSLLACGIVWDYENTISKTRLPD